ncbi:MAG: GNAT family N-acetyltransferase [Candidatus Riflebacteria bacterium]
MSPIMIKNDGNFSLAVLEPAHEDLIDRLLVWEKDESTRHLHMVTRSEEEFKNLKVTRDELKERVAEVFKSDRAFFWIIFMRGEPIGLLAGQIDPKQLIKHVPGTFWPSIVIGEASARGCGAGRRAMQWCEELALEKGCGRIEIGVFEFNQPARRLYESLGYHEFARTPDFTWWNGKLHADLRLEKNLEKQHV